MLYGKDIFKLPKCCAYSLWIIAASFLKNAKWFALDRALGSYIYTPTAPDLCWNVYCFCEILIWSIKVEIHQILSASHWPEPCLVLNWGEEKVRNWENPVHLFISWSIAISIIRLSARLENGFWVGGKEFIQVKAKWALNWADKLHWFIKVQVLVTRGYM